LFLDLIRRFDNQIDGDPRLSAVQNLYGFSQSGSNVSHDDKKIEVGMLSRGAMRIRTEQDDALRLKLRSNAVSQFEDAPNSINSIYVPESVPSRRSGF